VLLTLAAGALATLALAQQTDTIISVRPGTRLDVENFGGEVVVRTWDRDAVRIAATHSSRDVVEIDFTESVLSVGASSHRGPPAMVDYQITAPASMPLNVSGVYTDVTVEGARGEVGVETVQGDVRVTGGSGTVCVSSVQGDVVLEGTRGRIHASSVNGGATVTDASGEVLAETINGDIVLDRVESGSVEASTVNGAVSYDGTIRNDGRYRFATHNGDVSVAVPADANATVSVATFNGEFGSTFPVTLTETRRGKRFSFTLGSGSARIELESFDGTIHLRRPGEAPPGDGEEEEDGERHQEKHKDEEGEK
jgi:hypothetical protein